LIQYGSGTADLCLLLTDPAPDPVPAIFVSDLQDGWQQEIMFFA
jgi:hypothetical protein